MRFGYHLVALTLQGVARGHPGLALSAVSGARRGLSLYGNADDVRTAIGIGHVSSMPM
jgi:hypothetical protein